MVAFTLGEKILCLMVERAFPREFSVLFALLPAVTKCLRKQFKEERVSFVSQSKVASIVRGKPWWQEHEGVGHISYVVKEQEGMCSAHS